MKVRIVLVSIVIAFRLADVLYTSKLVLVLYSSTNYKLGESYESYTVEITLLV